jgi:hypothetical protein
VLYLQAVAGNQAVNGLLQRTIWVRNTLTDQIEPVEPGPRSHILPAATLRALLHPGDRYDEATGKITRLGGEEIKAPRGPRESPMSSAKQAREMSERRKARVSEARAEERSAMFEIARGEPSASLETATARGIDHATGLPVVAFLASDGEHQLFAANRGGRWQLMIASLPLPVADFILEMEARFLKIKGKAEDTTNKVIKKLPLLNKSVDNFTAAKAQALADLTAANATFANLASTVLQKTTDEEKLAGSLHRLIEVVKALAKRFGKYMAEPGKARLGKAKADSSHYLTKMSAAVERYRIEGLVARYQDQPAYEGSDFERDHQPHNDLIETMAAMPEFAGKRMQAVAAGRTQLGWSIMLHHDRHALGRTYGLLGGQVTTQFNNDLAANRPGKTAKQIVDWCIDYLVLSLRADVAAIKAVANNLGNYADLDEPVRYSEVKKAADAHNPPPTTADINTAIAARKNAVKQQIIDGEDRLLATESLVRDYDK